MIYPQPGDRLTEDHGETVVVTPGGAPRNFGPASSRDTVVWTSERPGGESVALDAVEEWAIFMKTRGISHVIVLMEDAELAAYQSPGLLAAYEEAGLKPHHVAYSSPSSSGRIFKLLESLADQKERAVAHYTHGQGRSGRVAAGWLVHRYGLDPVAAVQEALATAREHRVSRMGAPKQLQEWMGV